MHDTQPFVVALLVICVIAMIIMFMALSYQAGETHGRRLQRMEDEREFGMKRRPSYYLFYENTRTFYDKGGSKKGETDDPMNAT